MARGWFLIFGRRSGDRIKKRVTANPPQLFGNTLGRENKIHVAGCRGTARHAVILRRLRILRKRDSTLSLDGLQSERAVRIRARKDHADGAVGLIFGQSAQEIIYRMPARAPLLAWLQAQRTFGDRHAGIRGQDINVIGFDPHSVTDLGDRKFCSSCQQFRQDTFVGRVEVRHEYESHSGIHPEMLKQLSERFEPAGGCSDADHGKGIVSTRGAGLTFNALSKYGRLRKVVLNRSLRPSGFFGSHFFGYRRPFC